MCLRDGAQFQMKLCQEGLRSSELKKNMIVQCTSRINAECDELLEWMDLQLKN